MQMFLFLIRRSPWVFLLSLVTGTVSGISSAGLMALINDHLGDLSHVRAGFVEEFAGLAVLALGSQLASRMILLRLATSAVRAWRVSLSRQLLQAPLRSIERQGVSGLMATLTSDIGEVTEALIKFPVHCVNLVIICACFAYLFWLSWKMASSFFVTLLLGCVVYELIVRSSRGHMRALRDSWDRLIDLFSMVVEGNKELKLNRERRRRFMEQGIIPAADDMMRHAWRFNSTFAAAEVSGQMFFFCLLLSVPLLTTILHIDSGEIVSGFIVMLLYMSGRISEFIGTIPVFHKADVAKRKIESLGMLLGEEPGAGAPETGTLVELPAAGGGAQAWELELRGVEYQYEAVDGDSPFRVGPLNLRFGPGEIVFVVGGNGSGKSSFARLFTGLYVPTAGHIQFNGVAIDDGNRAAYRENFSTVFADFHLFKRVYETLSPDIRAEAGRLLEALQLAQKVRLDADGFSTIQLSQGQRKRLALLTSFLEDRRIYLFDEWAADQDPAFKSIFYTQILPELAARGKAVVIVSHDDHYFGAADRVVRFENGVVIEDRAMAAPAARPSFGVPAAELVPV